MPLDWPSFNKLPGDHRLNFENLCRGVVRTHWGQYGQFFALKNQPGVEFHLKLDRDCDVLGNATRWYGWQCKSFDITSTGNLKAVSKKDIKDSLDKTATYLPDLSDWILWTPFTLTKSDQDWFHGLSTEYSFTLHLWSSEELDTYLSGPALLLKSTYFGELVLTPTELEKRHNEAIVPIKERWLNPVHQETDVERVIRRMLGEPHYWEDMVNVGEKLEKSGCEIEKWKNEESSLDAAQKIFVQVCFEFSQMLSQFHLILSKGDINVIQQWLSNRKTLIHPDIRSFPRLLRKQNIPIALEATNALDDMYMAHDLFDEVQEYLGVGMVAILADAGGGKTHMAAEITSAQEHRPAGIFLHGRNFQRGQNVNDLAKHFVISGTPVDSMEKLIASLDAAGNRSGCILPIVIDGLNEAENPKEWKDVLSSIQAIVNNYPNVLVVCTLRTGEHKRHHWSNYDENTRESFAVQALPSDIWKLDYEGFGEDIHDAIKKYFKFYKINCERGVEIPIEFLSHPLNLRIFCEVTNPKREYILEIDYFPASLAHLFDKYIENACNRISGMKNLSYDSQDLQVAIYQLGISLWENRSREISDKTYRDLINDTDRDWNQSIVNLFAQEGIIFRNPDHEPGNYVITPVYDALGGQIIANSLLRKHPQDRDFTWFDTPSIIEAFSGEKTHPLAHDIFRSLVALVPSHMYGEQLWRNVPNEFKQTALLYAAELIPEHIDGETVDALAKLIEKKSKQVRKIFSRLWLTKSTLNHPLNADFLDSVLLKMSVDDRDLSWTEWVRSEKNVEKDRITKALVNLENKWKSQPTERSEADRLRAKALKWILTTTDSSLRSDATTALYWFGRGEPDFLFDETIMSLKINDPYISERMLAASYGVAMSLSVQSSNSSLFTSGSLIKFAGKIYDAMFKENALYATTHQLTRDFASKIIELTQYHQSHFFSERDVERTIPPYQSGSKKWGEKYLEPDLGIADRLLKIPKNILSEKTYNKINKLFSKKLTSKAIGKRNHVINQSPFRMDFENYTIGKLVPGRGNYDYNHQEYKKVRAQLQWRVEELGWSYEKFEAVEESIGSNQGYSRTSNDKLKISRYGKKYSWIAYDEMYGMLKDRGVIDDYDWWRSDSRNIDPSFSSPLEPQSFIKENFLGNDKISTPDWIRVGDRPNIEPYLELEEICEQQGPWLALDGFIKQENKTSQRETFFFIRSFLVSEKDKDEVIDFLRKQNLSGSWLPDKIDYSQTFFAEVPWSTSFPDEDVCDLSFVIGEKTVISQRPKLEIVIGEEGISVLSKGELEDHEEVQEEYKTYSAIMPVCGLKEDVTEASSVYCLTKKIINKLELVGNPQSFDLYTKTDEKVTNLIFDKGKDYGNSHHMYYIKEGFLKSFMKSEDLCLIWAIWGERNYALPWNEIENDHLPEPRYADFSWIKILEK